jgi:hypothetical protein
VRKPARGVLDWQRDWSSGRLWKLVRDKRPPIPPADRPHHVPAHRGHKWNPRNSGPLSNHVEPVEPGKGLAQSPSGEECKRHPGNGTAIATAIARIPQCRHGGGPRAGCLGRGLRE